MSEQSTSEAIGNADDTVVVVTRTVSHPLKSVWDVLMKPHGAEALLGEGGELGAKGEDWHANDGTWGVVRSFHPLEQIRFSWHKHDDAPKSLVDLHLFKDDEATTRHEIRHDHLSADADKEWLEQHWADALARIDNEAF